MVIQVKTCAEVLKVSQSKGTFISFVYTHSGRLLCLQRKTESEVRDTQYKFILKADVSWNKPRDTAEELSTDALYHTGDTRINK